MQSRIKLYAVKRSVSEMNFKNSQGVCHSVPIIDYFAKLITVYFVFKCIDPDQITLGLILFLKKSHTPFPIPIIWWSLDILLRV